MKPTTFTLSITTLAAVFALSGIAPAAGLRTAAAGLRTQPGKHHDPEAIFKRIDTNNDGKVTKEELAKAAEILREHAGKSGMGAKTGAAAADGHPGERLMERLDSNKDGVLSLEEFKKLGELPAQNSGRK